MKEMAAILSGADAAHHQSRVERALPYELRAVEVGLATAVRAWEMEAIMLEHRTRPTLRALLQKVCSPECPAGSCPADWMFSNECFMACHVLFCPMGGALLAHNQPAAKYASACSRSLTIWKGQQGMQQECAV